MTEPEWSRLAALVHALQRGGCDGPVAAAALGVEPAGLDAAIARVRAAGLDVVETDAECFALGTPVEWLDRAAILSAIAETGAPAPDALYLERLIDSTNGFLVSRAADAPGSAVCLAEGQTAGRGRRGRAWVSPLGANLYLSLSRRFEGTPGSLSTLPLAVGVVAAHEIERLGVPRVDLKWPNDLYANGCKLGGILIESAVAPGGGLNLVVGVGVNLALPADAASAIDQAFTDVRTLTGRPAARNRFAGRLAGALGLLLDGYAEAGFEPWRSRWEDRDLTRGRAITVLGEGGSIEGVGAGIAPDGALLVDTAGGRIEVRSGDVSVRLGSPG